MHVCVDDTAHMAYVEVLPDEKAVTTIGSLERAVAWFASIGISCERVITDNGSCYKSGLWHRACTETGTTPTRVLASTYTWGAGPWRGAPSLCTVPFSPSPAFSCSSAGSTWRR